MTLAERQYEVTSEFSFHLLRYALEGFNKNLSQLESDEYQQVYRKASKSFEIESVVLASREARELVISEQEIDQSVDRVASRYESMKEFRRDQEANGLNVNSLRQAIYRELMFDGVMQSVAAKGAYVSDLDVRRYYQLHPERFESPERRAASHILITVNPDYPENTFTSADARIEGLVKELAGRVNRFQEFATRYSECPTAVQGGRLGDVVRGQLYVELDAMLFSMGENQISPVVKTELGFHILLCERIKPGETVPFSKAAAMIRQYLTERQRRNCQKAWLASLQKASHV
jgi:peptidyl-prolyl cis-trans isomerase C